MKYQFKTGILRTCSTNDNIRIIAGIIQRIPGNLSRAKTANGRIKVKESGTNWPKYGKMVNSKKLINQKALKNSEE